MTLADPVRDGAGEPVLGVAAPAGHLRPGTGKYRVAAVRPVKADELVGALAEHGHGQGIGEDRRIIVDDQMSGARGRCHQGGQAGLSACYHTSR
jgi:hypothetical protein